MSATDNSRQDDDDVDAAEEQRLGRIARDAVRELEESGELGIPLSQAGWGTEDEFWEQVERTMGTPEARRWNQEEHELYSGSLRDGLDFSGAETEWLGRLTTTTDHKSEKPETPAITPSDSERDAREEFQAKLLEQMSTPEARRWNQEEAERYSGTLKDGLDPDSGSAEDVAREPRDPMLPT
ncbi:hypothetical protein [Rhodococcus sp. (in: high G+C Gram-positive bacteria)]|uniref:hypothetical protein n=1 Tax=Rhodococcus sp. TaxID=1831 RepID=UPI003B8A6F2E